MLSQQRLDTILELLKQRRTVSVSELSEELETSESTIRRDITALDEMGKLKKIYGGAASLDESFTSYEPDVNARSSLNVEQKKAIAQYAASLINDDDFVFIDAGTTTAHLTEYITNTKATYVTNGIVHAKTLIQRGCRAYIIGGRLKLATEAVTGSEAVVNIKKYNFSKCFLGTNGVSRENGYTTPDIDEAIVKREAVSKSYVSFVLADSTKLGVVSSVTFADIKQACLITDKVLDKRYFTTTAVKEVMK